MYNNITIVLNIILKNSKVKTVAIINNFAISYVFQIVRHHCLQKQKMLVKFKIE